MRKTIAVMVAALTIGVASTALADDAGYKTTSSFGFYDGTPDAFLGDVSSDNADCEPQRRIKVFLKKPGRDKRIGADRSDAGGQWIIETANAAPGKYYATIAKRRLPGSSAHDHPCRPYRSSSIRFG